MIDYFNQHGCSGDLKLEVWGTCVQGEGVVEKKNCYILDKKKENEEDIRGKKFTITCNYIGIG